MLKWFDHILYQTRLQPERPAIVMEQRVITYGMLREGIERCARRIVALNLAADSLVAVMVANPVKHLTLCLALFRIGIRSVSLAPEHPGIETLTLAAILCDPDGGGARARFGERVTEVGPEWFAADLPGAGPLPPSFTSPTQLCRVGLTSGSTGAPKAVHYEVQDVGWRALKFLDVNWTFVLSMPGLASNWGFTNACATLATGRTLCLADSPHQAVRMIELFGIDFMLAATEQLLAITRVTRKTGSPLKSLRTVWTSGARPTNALLDAATAHVCRDILCQYASSETSIIAAASAHEVRSKPGFAGHVRPGVDAAIFDSAGKKCAPGERGAIRLRLDEGYGGRPVSGETDDRPWIDVGDVGWITAEGELYIIGRAVDLAVTGADTPQISPVQEIEDLLRLEWDTADAAAVLMTGDAGDASPQIWVAVVDHKGATAERLGALARPRGIAHPIRLIEVRTIPRGANGKINRGQLRTQLLAAAAVAKP